MRADPQIYPLGTTLAATGAGVAIRGGEYMFLANGTVGGATVSLQIQMPDASWADVQALAGNAPIRATVLPLTATPILLPACTVRAAITGGAGVSLNAWLGGIG
jgi:hypothetical protein